MATRLRVLTRDPATLLKAVPQPPDIKCTGGYTCMCPQCVAERVALMRHKPRQRAA